MTDLTERLRVRDMMLCDEAADEIEHLALDLQTERAAVVALRAEVAEWEKLRGPALLHVNLLRGQPAQLTQAMFAHLAGIDALREDAERYRWLRNEAESSDWEYIGHQTAINSDREIDAAIAARKAAP